MKNGFTWMLLGLIAAMFLVQLVEVGRSRAALERPDEALSALTKQYPELGPALVAADRGETQLLTTWLVRAPVLVRQTMANAVMGSSMQGAPLAPDGKSLPDDQTGWNARYRMMAFVRVGTGLPAIDHELDNALAYTLVVGSPTVSPGDLTLAGDIAERIERRLRAEPHHGRYDTLGCVRFRQGFWAKAKEAFAQANELLAKEDGKQAGHAITVALYKARLEAASFNVNPSPNQPLKDLPRDIRP